MYNRKLAVNPYRTITRNCKMCGSRKQCKHCWNSKQRDINWDTRCVHIYTYTYTYTEQISQHGRNTCWLNTWNEIPECWDYHIVRSDISALEKIKLNKKQQVKRCTIINRICSRKTEGITDKIKIATPTTKILSTTGTVKATRQIILVHGNKVILCS